ncbi:hypothetical protein [Nocardia sp. NPDC057353]|uniref:hypothetical protein n=1 Tax=Nocardia sp. NPDC057353 TaxID=3346104 RepID=UPI0036410BB1
MRSGVLMIAALAFVLALVAAPGLVLGNLALAAFVWLTWRMVRSSWTRRGVGR